LETSSLQYGQLTIFASNTAPLTVEMLLDGVASSVIDLPALYFWFPEIERFSAVMVPVASESDGVIPFIAKFSPIMVISVVLLLITIGLLEEIRNL
jgi:hypothetical protein